MDNKLLGLNINQDDYPWWYTHILGWLGMVKQINDCPGENAEYYRTQVTHIVEHRDGRPEAIYKLYDQYKTYVGRLMRKLEK